MRNYRKVVATSALALVLSTSVYAGDGIMTTDKASPTPTPTATSTTQNLATNGIMYTDVAKPATGTTDPTTEIALNLLQSVLALF
jgi:hypothetical protein